MRNPRKFLKNLRQNKQTIEPEALLMRQSQATTKTGAKQQMRKFITRRISPVLAALAVLGLALPFSLATAPTALALDDSDKPAVEKIIKDYLLENPEVIRDALQELERRTIEAEKQRQKQMISENRELLLDEKYSFTTGNKDGDVTVVEFFDYNCPYCRQAFKDLLQLMQEDKNVRVVLKEFPILGEASQKAALAALAARKQGKYMEFHQALLEAKGRITESSLLTTAESIGLDVEQLKKDMESQDVKTALEKNMEVGIRLGINGTPTFIFNDQVVPQVLPYDAMKGLISKLRKAS